MKQVDIFGHEVELSEIEEKEKESKTLKAKFRETAGYKEGFKCGNCKHLKKFGYHGKKYFKCEFLGISHSTATDVHKKDVACRNFENGVKE